MTDSATPFGMQLRQRLSVPAGALEPVLARASQQLLEVEGVASAQPVARLDEAGVGLAELLRHQARDRAGAEPARLRGSTHAGSPPIAARRVEVSVPGFGGRAAATSATRRPSRRLAR